MTITANQIGKQIDALGCSDGRCVIRQPPGMHTNGGCACVEKRMDLAQTQRVRAALTLRKKQVGVLEGRVLELELVDGLTPSVLAGLVRMSREYAAKRPEFQQLASDRDDVAKATALGEIADVDAACAWIARQRVGRAEGCDYDEVGDEARAS